MGEKNNPRNRYGRCVSAGAILKKEEEKNTEKEALHSCRTTNVTTTFRRCSSLNWQLSIIFLYFTGLLWFCCFWRFCCFTAVCWGFFYSISFIFSAYLYQDSNFSSSESGFITKQMNLCHSSSHPSPKGVDWQNVRFNALLCDIGVIRDQIEKKSVFYEQKV